VRKKEFDAALANRPVVLTVQRERRSGGNWRMGTSTGEP